MCQQGLLNKKLRLPGQRSMGHGRFTSLHNFVGLKFEIVGYSAVQVKGNFWLAEKAPDCQRVFIW